MRYSALKNFAQFTENLLPLLKRPNIPIPKMDNTTRLEYLEEKVLEQAEASQVTANTLWRILVN